MKVKEIRVMIMDDLRKVCCDNEFCDCMTNTKYDAFLNKYSGNVNNAKLLKCAEEIIVYSSMYTGITAEEFNLAASSIMYTLFNQAVTVTFSIE